MPAERVATQQPLHSQNEPLPRPSALKSFRHIIRARGNKPATNPQERGQRCLIEPDPYNKETHHNVAFWKNNGFTAPPNNGGVPVVKGGTCAKAVSTGGGLPPGASLSGERPPFLKPAPAEHSPASGCRHAGSKSNFFLTTSLVWLICRLHRLRILSYEFEKGQTKLPPDKFNLTKSVRFSMLSSSFQY